MTNPPQPVSVSPRARVGLAWLEVVLWAGVIFLMSTATFSSSFTGEALGWILKVLGIHLTPTEFADLHLVVRKAAHLTEYAIFGLFVYHALEAGGLRAWRGRTALFTILIAGVYSLTDEFHQTFVQGRTPALHDCAIDTLGASLGMLLLYVRARFLQAKHSRIAAAKASPEESRKGVVGL